MLRKMRYGEEKLKWCVLHNSYADGLDDSRSEGDTGWSPWHSGCGAVCIDYEPRNKRSGACRHVRKMMMKDCFPDKFPKESKILTQEEKDYWRNYYFENVMTEEQRKEWDEHCSGKKDE